MKRIYVIFLLLLISLIGCKSSILDDPATSISFSIPERLNVKLSVENSYNTLIVILVDREMEPGHHNITFDASNLAEGVYFYTLELKGISNDFYSKTIKSILLVK